MEMEWRRKLTDICRRGFQLKYLLPVLAGLLAAAVAVRIIQLNVAVDFTTGFYSKKTLWIPLLTVLLLIYTAFSTVHALYHKIRPVAPFRMKNPLPAAVITGAAGAMLMLEGFIGILALALRVLASDPMNLITMILEIASGAAFVYHASLLYRRLYERLQNHILLAVPVVWALFSLISSFVRHTTIARVSEYVFDILFSAVLVLFLLYYARYTAGLLEENRKYRLVISGFWLVIFGTVSALPVLFCKLFEPNKIGQHIAAPALSTVALTVFAGMLMFLIVAEAGRQSDKEETAFSASTDCEYQYQTVRVNLKWIK